jgi:hypothetical protein
MVSLFDIGYSGTSLKDDCAAFVAKEMRQVFIGAFNSSYLADLRAAYTAAIYLDQHLADIELRNLNFIDNKRRVRRDEDCSSGLQLL